MYKNFFLSLFLHSIIIFILISNLSFWQKDRKITYKKFSVKISSKISNKPKKNQQNKATKITEDIKKKIITKDNEKKEASKPSVQSLTKPKNEINIKEKSNTESPPKKDLPIKNIEKPIKKPKKVKSKPIKDTKKAIPKSIKKFTQKNRKNDIFKEDIFSKLTTSNKNFEISDVPADLSKEEQLIIKEQISQHWIKTPCTAEMKISITLLLDCNCNIIHREPININSGSQYKACLESCLNATHKSSPLNLDPESCKKYANKAITINFTP
jgi:hypothetical protein